MLSENLPQTQFCFTLPVGLLDGEGTLHREVIMRSLTGWDELFRERDLRVRENPAYGVLVMLSRSIVQLGEISVVGPDILEGLFLADLDYLQGVYNQINPPEAGISLAGELRATP
ncbi:hypothetical protein L1F28_08930 [Arthrospira platensis NCB002]|jgi:hypothetical protein|uniref:Uncharacterized protein n=1 Tax=Limnospira platensis NIES-46 TaxID=1236695 RepID=A0A5M3T3S0_LIMPL|nr:hypothetical protein AP285_29155 [Arthrospira platensis YZ]MDF2208871.1 hypothetical protein [Arthrospira platensis NCB002]MDT9182091.1 hypothetical protein [Limnospira sp. PMC 289.06]QQW32289.2 hypothetical protein AP9108_31885 [Arthrospira sp. PCC 9108]BAI94393.1 hypothetical protein NIES39_R00840 [Arthrospira platensis NIES-39]GCE92446.1 hypothetical protein NIES46_04860 [Arthrospira platensis NIES-46]